MVFSALGVSHMGKPFRREGLRGQPQPALEDAEGSHTRALLEG